MSTGTTSRSARCASPAPGCTRRSRRRSATPSRPTPARRTAPGRGKPVALVFPDADGTGTLFLPNTVTLVKGGPNPDAARKLVEFLLRPETEKRLAEGGGFQIPLNPAVRAELPAQVLGLSQTRAMA